jgi:hypothetical protein
MPNVDGSLGNVMAVEGERWSTERHSALLLKIPMALPKYPIGGPIWGPGPLADLFQPHQKT